jgi:hypothetical protein
MQSKNIPRITIQKECYKKLNSIRECQTPKKSSRTIWI